MCRACDTGTLSCCDGGEYCCDQMDTWGVLPIRHGSSKWVAGPDSYNRKGHQCTYEWKYYPAHLCFCDCDASHKALDERPREA